MEAVQDKDGWREWVGGSIPVDCKTRVDIRQRDGRCTTLDAGVLKWSHDGAAHDIVAWRPWARPTAQPGLLDALSPKGPTDKDGWHKWNGLGWCPAGFHGREEVEVRRRNGDVSTGEAWVFSWRHGVCKPETDIVEWRLIAPASIAKTVEQCDVNAAPTLAEQVDHPAHYNQGGIECIDAIRAALTPEEFRGFCKGNALKYIWRERHKGGAESLEKAAWYMKEAEK